MHVYQQNVALLKCPCVPQLRLPFNIFHNIATFQTSILSSMDFIFLYKLTKNWKFSMLPLVLSIIGMRNAISGA